MLQFKQKKNINTATLSTTFVVAFTPHELTEKMKLSGQQLVDNYIFLMNLKFN